MTAALHAPNEQQGHWILARMGKRVLRPGGKELTLQMLGGLDIGQQDDVLEIAPGLGFTAGLTLQKRPQSYVAVDQNAQAVQELQTRLGGEGVRFLPGDAAALPLDAESVDKVYGEAMLTMQSARQKVQIIGEARRVLRSGGLYGIHELALKPDDLDEDTKAEVQRALAKAIRVQARPLTVREWQDTLRAEGFMPELTRTNPMHLLEPRRVLDDEGLSRTLKIMFNVLTHPEARKRIFTMRGVFRKYASHLCAITIVARKISITGENP